MLVCSTFFSLFALCTLGHVFSHPFMNILQHSEKRKTTSDTIYQGGRRGRDTIRNKQNSYWKWKVMENTIFYMFSDILCHEYTKNL